MSESDNCHCARTTKVVVKVMGTPEEEGLETTLENRHRGCGHDMLRQTVQNMGNSNREGLIADSGQTCMTDIQIQ